MSQYPPGTPSHDMEFRSISPPYMGDRSEFGFQKQRKAIATGGGRAWTEEEVSLLKLFSQHQTDIVEGSLSAAHSQKQDAIQAHRGATSQDRAGLPSSLSSNVLWQQPEETWGLSLVSEQLCLLHSRLLSPRPVAWSYSLLQHSHDIAIFKSAIASQSSFGWPDFSPALPGPTTSTLA